MPGDVRLLPSVDQIANAVRERVPGVLATALAREALAVLRADLLADRAAPRDREAAVRLAVTHAEQLAEAIAAPAPRPVINGTGTVLHTGLGRAPLSARAQAAVTRVLRGWCQVEFDLPAGERGDRQQLIAPLLCRLTGAEAALAVNNCAGATVLALQAMAQGREVIVSRGELVEIGGSFRIPEIMAAAGCRLVEVGSTNKTRIEDYRRAVRPETALLLKVHKSNFVQEGFVAEAATTELVALGRELGIPVLCDQGSGCLVDLQPIGLDCARLTDELGAGADLVCASGDKLLGGPQAGLILGRRAAVERCARHPLARAMRIDKLHLAALAGTLQDYLLDDPLTAIPALHALHESLAAVRTRAEAVLGRLAGVSGLSIEEDRSAVGSGALPTQGPATWVLAIRRGSATVIARALRLRPLPVVPRVARGAVLIDLRTVLSDQVEALADAIRAVVDNG